MKKLNHWIFSAILYFRGWMPSQYIDTNRIYWKINEMLNDCFFLNFFSLQNVVLRGTGFLVEPPHPLPKWKPGYAHGVNVVVVLMVPPPSTFIYF